MIFKFYISIYIYGSLTIHNCQRIPKIIGKNDNVTAESGTKVQLKCEVENLGENIVSWLKKTDSYGNKTFLFISSGGTRVANERYTVMNYFNQYTLEVREVNEDDAGTYQCQISTDPVTFIDISLFVYYRPKITYTPTDIFATEDSDVELKCEARGAPKPKISWKRLDGNVLPQGGFVYVGTHLNLKKVNKHHRGSYVCEAENESGRDIRVVTLFMEFAPTVKTPEYKYIVEARGGTKAELDCRVEGNPPPHVYWRFDGMEVHGENYKTSNFSEGNDIINSGLTVITVGKKDFGNYTCVAVNNFGNDEKTFVLKLPSKYGYNSSLCLKADRFQYLVILHVIIIILFNIHLT